MDAARLGQGKTKEVRIGYVVCRSTAVCLCVREMDANVDATLCLCFYGRVCGDRRTIRPGNWSRFCSFIPAVLSDHLDCGAARRFCAGDSCNLSFCGGR